MAKKFLTGLTLVNLDSDPLSGSEGELYYNTSASVAKIYKSGAWSELGAGGGSNISVGSTEPANPEIGDGWYDNTNGSFYIYDGTYWVEVNGVVGLTQEQVQDYVAPLFTNATNTNVVATYDDENNVINLNTSGSLISVDSIVYPDYITFDTTPETSSTAQGTISWDSGNQTLQAILSPNVTLQVGQENIALCYNGTGSPLVDGQVVYINGVQGQRPSLALADADMESTSSKVFGVVTEPILNGSTGFVSTFGLVNGINTYGYTSGQALWLSSTPGQFTSTMPEAPAHAVFIGYVVRVSSAPGSNNGSIFVNPQNGYELAELHDIVISGASAQQALVLDSDGLWKNQSIVNSVNGTDNQISIDTNGYGDVTFSLPSDLIAPGNLTVTGDLTVSGSTTFINTESLNIEDNIITLNSGVTGSPILDAGIEVERGTEPNKSITWQEDDQAWVFNSDIKAALLKSDDNLEIRADAISGLTSEIVLSAALNSIEINNSGSVTIRPGDELGQVSYAFGKDYLMFPDNSQQSTAFLGMESYSTSDLTEGTNLYFTEQRVNDILTPALTDYLTIVNASNTYQPLNNNLTDISTINGDSGLLRVDNGDWFVDQNQYLTESSASSTYLTQAEATSTYLTQSNAAATYAQQSELSNYLTNANAAIYYQPLDSDLTAISNISGSAGFLTTDGSGNWSVDQTGYVKDIQGTTGEIEVSSSSGVYTVGLPNDVYITNDLEVGGNLNVTGSISYQNELVISDPLIYLGEDNNSNVVDLGFVASFNDGTYQHTGLVRDASDNKWKLFDGVTDEPTSVVNFDQAFYDTLLVGGLENSGSSIVLNALQASGSVDAALVVERGSDPDVAIKWNETTNKWQYTNDGTTYTDIGSGSSGGSSAAAVTSDPPSSPELNQVWQDLDTGRIYIWDGTFWVEVQQNGSLGLLRYLGASSTAPTTSIDGSNLQIGEVYFDTVFNSMRVYNGSIWEDAFSAASLSVNRWVKTATGGETTLSGVGDNLVTLTYTPGIEEVFLNGVKLIRSDDYTATSGSTIIVDALPAGSVVEVLSYSAFDVANVYTKGEIDTTFSILSASVSNTYTKTESDNKFVTIVNPSTSGSMSSAGNINPSATNTYDLGTSALRWRNIYTQDLHLSNGIGDYTVIEGEEDLFLVNNKNGKSFKFALIQVDPSEVPPKSESN